MNRVFILVVFVLLASCKNESPSDKNAILPMQDIKSHGDEDKEVEFATYPAEAVENIDLQSINIKLIESLVFNGINDVREQEGFKPLKISGVLDAAAKLQNDYQIKEDKLSHYQDNPELKTTIQRVKYYGGDLQAVGENVQFYGFTMRKFGGKREILTPSYLGAAKGLLDGWVKSPGHYRNLINPEFEYVGTSVAYSQKKNALFATQVFGKY